MAGSAARPSQRSGAAAPSRKGRAPAARPAAKPTVLGRVFARPGVIVAGATFAAVMTGIVANALLFQKGHHPSPLFGPAPAETSAAVPSSMLAPPTPVPVPVQRQAVEEPAPATPVAEAPAPVPAANTAPAAAHKPAAKPAHAAAAAAKPAHKPAAAAHRDPIGDLLGKTGH